MTTTEPTTCARCKQTLQWLTIHVRTDLAGGHLQSGQVSQIAGWFSGELNLSGADVSLDCPARGTNRRHQAPVPPLLATPPSANGAGKRSGR
jgi:hypothetical protein